LNINNALALAIKKIILTKFLDANIKITFDKEQNEYFISTRNRELYYSEAYGMLVLEINQNILWKQGIFNFYFILDVRKHKFDKITKNITFSLADEIVYKPWGVKKQSLFIDTHISVNDFSLAA